MIAKDTLQVTLTKNFSLKERFRVLFGQQLIQHAFVEIRARYIAKSKEVQIEKEMLGVQAFFGTPNKQKQIPDTAASDMGLDIASEDVIDWISRRS